MGDMVEDFNAYRDYFREKKQHNKDYSTNLLIENGINFESRNGGIHLMINTEKGRINFYPSTGLYNGVISGRGIRNLLKELKGIDVQKTSKIEQ